MLRHWSIVFSLFLFFPVAAYAQKGHAKDVLTELPMPELFLQPVKYVAHTGSTTVYLRTEPQFCVDSENQPLSPCLLLPYQTTPPATWTNLELFSVVIPRKSLRDVISFVPRFGPSFSLRNYDLANEHDALFQARLIVTLESPAFPDGPVDTLFGDRTVTMSLPSEKMFGDTIHYTRDGMIGRQWLRDNVGLSEKQVDAFFDNAITVRVSVRVRALLLEYGSIYVGVLIQGY
jgi:hypothetical protein